MKKIFTLAVAALLTIGTASAQKNWFVGGSVGVGFSSYEPEGGNKDKTNLFTISPEAGYQFNDTWAAGLGATFINGKIYNFRFNGTLFDEKMKWNEWSVAPFVRATVVKWGNFETMLKCVARIGGGEFQEDTDGALNREFTHLGVFITTVLAYSISETIQLQAVINSLGLSYNYMDVKDIGKQSDFGFSANTNDVLNTGNFQIGFVVRF